MPTFRVLKRIETRISFAFFELLHAPPFGEKDPTLGNKCTLNGTKHVMQSNAMTLYSNIN